MNKFVTVFARHWFPIAAFNTLLMAATSVVLLTTPRVWTAQAEMILPATTRSLNADLGTLGVLSGGEVAFSQQLNPLKVLSSILRSDRVMQQVRAEDAEKNEFSRLNSYRELFSVSPQNESTVISITADGSSPELAKERLSRLIDAFQNRLIELRQANASQSSQLVEKELEQAQTALQEAQRSLADFQSSANLVDVDSQAKEAVTAISRLRTSQAEMLAQARAKNTQSQMIASRLGFSPQQAMRSLRLGENDRYKFFQQKLAEVIAALAQAQSLYTDEHPQVRYLLLQRNELQQQLNQSIAQAAANSQDINNAAGSNSAALIQQMVVAESEAAALQQQALQMQPLIDQFGGTLRSLPKQQVQLSQLQRRYDIAESIYRGLVAKAQEAKLGAFSAYPNVQVLDQPDVDPLPTGPKKRLIFLGALIASLAGSSALALILESRNPLLSMDDLQSIDVPILGNIPTFHGLNSLLEFDDTEVFQHLASAVSMLQLSNQRLMVTSAAPEEGKTTVALGLAAALATLGFRVLLVDGDFRQARLSQILRSRNPFPPESDHHLPFPTITIRPKLDFLSLPMQRQAVLGFVAHGEFAECLNNIQSSGQYDYVVLDSSPISLASETALLSRVAENVLLVVRPGKSNRNPVGSSLEQMEHYHANAVGLVINGIEAPPESYLTKSRNASINL